MFELFWARLIEKMVKSPLFSAIKDLQDALHITTTCSIQMVFSGVNTPLLDGHYLKTASFSSEASQL
ncbi:MAG: hypothetical protein ACON44_08605 [Candidatus Puniceispirillaceae bacterium]